MPVAIKPSVSAISGGNFAESRTASRHRRAPEDNVSTATKNDILNWIFLSFSSMNLLQAK